MKTITLQEALSAGACYNAEQIIDLFGDRTELSVKDIAALEIPDADKVWAFTRPHFLDTKEKVIRFAVFCAEQCVEIFEAQRPDDKRPQAAVEAAKAWLESPSDESVEAAANAAAWAVRDAEMRAYWAAAWAVRDAASAAAWDAVRDAASAAAWDAARAAAMRAHWAAAWAVRDAASAAAWAAQVKFLIKLLTEGT